MKTQEQSNIKITKNKNMEKCIAYNENKHKFIKINMLEIYTDMHVECKIKTICIASENWRKNPCKLETHTLLSQQSTAHLLCSFSSCR